MSAAIACDRLLGVTSTMTRREKTSITTISA